MVIFYEVKFIDTPYVSEDKGRAENTVGLLSSQILILNLGKIVIALSDILIIDRS